MIDRTKKLPARFYVNPAGRQPVREWILEVPAGDRHTVGKDIQMVEFGWPSALRPSRQGFVGGTQRSRQQPDSAGDFLHG
jgi:hypothetical protein